MINKRILIFLFAIGLFSACSSSKKATTNSAPQKGKTSELTEDQQMTVTYSFFNAIKEKLNGNVEKALGDFGDCLRKDPTNHAAMYEVASIYNDARKYNDALFYANNAYNLDKENVWYALLLADTYNKLGKYAKADEIYTELIRKNPYSIEYYFQHTEALYYQNKYAEAIKSLDKIEELMGINRELTFKKQRLYLKLGKVDEAANELEKLIKSEPENLDNYSALVELYQVNNQPEKAIEVIHRMQVIDPDNPTISLALAEYYRSSGKKAESFNELKKAFASPKLESELKIRILTSYLPLVSSNPDMLEQALELSKVLSETHPTEANPQAVHGDFLAINKNYEQARIQYRNALQIDKKNLQAWQQLILVESELRDFVSMETESDEALTFYPDQSVFYLFNGIAKSQNKKYEEAAKVLLAGSKLVVDNDAQLIEFYSSLGEAYNSLKRFEESDKYYEKALAIDPNNANVLNNYAYFLSERNENLEKAASMSKKSNDLVPDNSSNQDTYAWVLYKQGKYNDALAWLDKAMKNGASENGTILEHYGDVLFHLSKLDDALIYWKKAKATGDYSDKLDQKINEKRVIE